jgi:hypothetical protein
MRTALGDVGDRYVSVFLLFHHDRDEHHVRVGF